MNATQSFYFSVRELTEKNREKCSDISDVHFTILKMIGNEEKFMNVIFFCN